MEGALVGLGFQDTSVQWCLASQFTSPSIILYCALFTSHHPRARRSEFWAKISRTHDRALVAQNGSRCFRPGWSQRYRQAWHSIGMPRSTVHGGRVSWAMPSRPNPLLLCPPRLVSVLPRKGLCSVFLLQSVSHSRAVGNWARAGATGE